LDIQISDYFLIFDLKQKGVYTATAQPQGGRSAMALLVLLI
jgi:hypothetical protein